VSVYISNFDNPDGTWTVVHDDAASGSHTGQVQPTDVVRAINMDGSPNENFATLTCPVCGDTSTHPVGGGAQPPLVQELFVRLALREDCPCPQITNLKMVGRATKDATQAAHDHVKEHAEAMDGEGRWQVTQEQLDGIS